MSNITIHPAIAGNTVLLQHLQIATNSYATQRPNDRYARLVPNKPTPSATWLRGMGQRALNKGAANAIS